MRKRGSESATHYALKWKAFEWLWSRGYRQIAFECTLGGYVADVLAIKDVIHGRKPLVTAIEVKVSREDFLRDATADDRAIRANVRLQNVRNEIQDVYTQAAESGESYRTTKKHVRPLEKRRNNLYRTAHHHSKFHDPEYVLQTSSRLLIIPSGIIERNEVPQGWGLLDESNQVIVKPPRGAKPVAWQTAVVILREIARVHSQESMIREMGVTWQGRLPVFPSFDDMIKKVQS